jgi:hypothetical protein
LTAVTLPFLRRFLPPAALPDTAWRPRRRRPFSGSPARVFGSSSLTPSASAAAAVGDARARSGSGRTCTTECQVLSSCSRTSKLRMPQRRMRCCSQNAEPQRYKLHDACCAA